jgi:peroxiredoxin (alkyl hydroperoxide reductase subunit C)
MPPKRTAAKPEEVPAATNGTATQTPVHPAATNANGVPAKIVKQDLHAPTNPAITLQYDVHHEPLVYPQIGQPAPKFTATAVVDGQFKQVSLSDYHEKYLVLLFYPLDFTFVCPTEILAFNDRVEEFRKLNAEVLAISVDSEFSHLAWTQVPREKGGVGSLILPLVADQTRAMSKAYGVYRSDLGHTLRGLFIIDGRGILRQITINDLPVGRDVDETIRLIEAFQYTDENGVVCPANWRPGKPTIVPNPTDKLQYFQQVNPATA